MRKVLGLWIVCVCLFLLFPSPNMANGETTVAWDTNLDFGQGVIENLTIAGTGTSAGLGMSMVNAWARVNFSVQPPARQGVALASLP
ncbi:MAG: hypothetical protein QXS83_00855, partial [Thermoplasmata archaeon]